MAIQPHLVLLTILLCLLDLIGRAHLLHVQVLHSLQSVLILLEVDKGEGPALVVLARGQRVDATENSEHLLDLVLVPGIRKILHIKVGVVRNGRWLTLILLQELSHLHSLLPDLHAIDTLDGLLSRLLRLVMHEAIAVGLSAHVRCYLTRQDVAEQAEGVVQSFVVDVQVKTLHVDVACSALAQARVALAPHDAARAILDAGVVERVQSLLGIRDAVIIHISVAQ
mmetsp:Transcript_83792/g.179556  ORF Transcript_83792/g.179556 Transcript_83792/m.179556 type:complete len:225 (-) Transcript_83792:208-882(-)